MMRLPMPWFESVGRGRPSVVQAAGPGPRLWTEAQRWRFFQNGLPGPELPPAQAPGPGAALFGLLPATLARVQRLQQLPESEPETNQPEAPGCPRYFQPAPVPRRFGKSDPWR